MKRGLLGFAVLTILGAIAGAAEPTTNREDFRAYLMVHFGPQEKLYYAYSRDALHWTALNGGKPVFDPGVRLRDPYLARVNGKFHMVHTKGWDNPIIYYWESTDLIDWKGGPIQVVEDAKRRAWASEFTYVPFYVYWASIHNGHNTIHYVATKDWTDITPARSAVYFDLGIHDIDMSVVEHKGTYYAFHKPGDVNDMMNNLLLTAKSLNPKKDSFGGKGPGKDVLAGASKPIEGPEVIQLIGQDKWYVYGDPFHSPMEAWETSDFARFAKIDVSVPKGAKHCGMIQIAEAELQRLLEKYPGETISLAGEWQFSLDPRDEGRRTSPKAVLSDTIRLPSTTDEAGKGPENSDRGMTARLTRIHPYAGAAWYRRDIVIPEAWKDKTVTLLLERTKNSRAWIDETLLGERDSLTAPHVYEVGRAGKSAGRLASGKHHLTICVNNARHPPVNGGHQLSEDTQTDWNGIVGRIELQAHGPAWIESQRVFAKIDGIVRVELNVRNESSSPCKIGVAIRDKLSGEIIAEGTGACGADRRARVTVALKSVRPPKLWSEFSPALYVAESRVDASGAESESIETTFGFREFAARGTQFSINGKGVFLRGKHDACVFPRTGYAPMDVDSWTRVFTIAKSYGLNHYRFHSWCPPEAAFAAADKIGVYLQPELPTGGEIGKDAAQTAWCLEEGRRILRAFGNHPSFVMLALGNEMHGGREVRARIVRELRQFDPRHLYAQGSNYDVGEGVFAAGDDFFTTMRARKGAEGAVRGSFAHLDAPLGRVQLGPPSTNWDYRTAIAGLGVPVIGHEVGQYQVFPDFREIEKYTGVLQPRNFGIFRERLKAKGMIDQAGDFVRASGALAVICYRAEIEAALRTPGFGGFQLLDLQDYPGQGTALVGILDAFMDSKGLIAPETWREFCCETVPLAIFPKYTWTTDETFAAEVKVANYGPAELRGATVVWSLSEAGGKKLAAGELPARNIEQGGLVSIGSIAVPLANITAPQSLTLCISISGTHFCNHYELWVYPRCVDTATLAGVTIARTIDERVLKILADGGRVLLLPKPGKLANGVEGFFASDFWCYPMFRGGKPLGTLGILCEPRHPAPARFPTEFHSNWQWFHILMNSRAVILDDTPANLRPLVQVIDNFDADRNHKLGLIFEANVGKGRLLVCTSDLPALGDRPEARQLLTSLLEYAASEQFRPVAALTAAKLQALLRIEEKR